jgi:hypothetical protein
MKNKYFAITVIIAERLSGFSLYEGSSKAPKITPGDIEAHPGAQRFGLAPRGLTL